MDVFHNSCPRWKIIGHVAISWAPEGKRKRPKATWRATVERERKEVGWGLWEEVRAVAANQERRRCSVEALRATRCEED